MNFRVITVRQDVIYHAQQIGADKKTEGERIEQISFTVIFNGVATLEFETHWGTSSSYSYVGYEAFDQEPQENLYIINGEPLTIAANVLQSVGTTAPNTIQTETTTTVATTTTTTTTTMATAVTEETDAETTTTEVGEVNKTTNEEN